MVSFDLSLEFRAAFWYSRVRWEAVLVRNWLFSPLCLCPLLVMPFLHHETSLDG